jgi:hypothetical protein
MFLEGEHFSFPMSSTTFTRIWAKVEWPNTASRLGFHEVAYLWAPPPHSTKGLIAPTTSAVQRQRSWSKWTAETVEISGKNYVWTEVWWTEDVGAIRVQ